MPHLFRTLNGREYRPGEMLRLALADGTPVEGIWGGSAQGEKLLWWINKPGHLLSQTKDQIAGIAIRDADTGEIRWGAAPVGGHLFFVLKPPPSGKNYRIAKMVTTAATPAQAAYFNEERFSLFGTLGRDGSVREIEPPPSPPPDPPRQPELF